MTSAFGRAPSISGSVAPSYTTEDLGARSRNHDDGIELRSFDGRSSTSLNQLEDAPPAYHDGPAGRSSAAAFHPTVHFQIQTKGKPWLSLPLAPVNKPIPVYPVDPVSGVPVDTPAYLSVRPNRSRGSSVLLRGGELDGAKVSSTTYRFGPGRHPQVCLLDDLTAASAASATPLDVYQGEDDAEDESAADEGGADESSDAAGWDAFAVTPKGLLTRAVCVKTRLGSFEWRYATRAERKAAGGVSSLLVFERVVRVFHAAGSSSRKEDEVRTPVAHFVRSDEVRSPGSSGSSAGNGGRLMIDLSSVGEADKADRRMVEVLVVTTAITMLKKEVDRRRAQQIAIMSGVAAGG